VASTRRGRSVRNARIKPSVGDQTPKFLLENSCREESGLELLGICKGEDGSKPGPGEFNSFSGLFSAVGKLARITKYLKNRGLSNVICLLGNHSLSNRSKLLPMLFKRTLQRESDLSSRTITIEDGSSSCKYMVIVYTVPSQPLPRSTNVGARPEIERYPFNQQVEAIRCAQQKLADSRTNGFVILS
jgi:hypothetical protein